MQRRRGLHIPGTGLMHVASVQLRAKVACWRTALLGRCLYKSDRALPPL